MAKGMHKPKSLERRQKGYAEMSGKGGGSATKKPGSLKK